MYEPRFYRSKMQAKGLVSFEVIVKETDLHISASKNLALLARKAVLQYRADIEGFIAKQPIFATTFSPYEVPNEAPEIIKEMAKATACVGVGPMASVAGAVAQFVGKDLLRESTEVIVENGGDIFLKTKRKRRMGIYAGNSSLSNKVALMIHPEETPLGVCTSSATVGHSTSLGCADAVVAVSKNTLLADAAATAIGNRIKNVNDIGKAIAFAQSLDGIAGVVIIKDDKLGVCGELELTNL